jgi:hypothetical protein
MLRLVIDDIDVDEHGQPFVGNILMDLQRKVAERYDVYPCRELWADICAVIPSGSFVMWRRLPEAEDIVLDDGGWRVRVSLRIGWDQSAADATEAGNA